MGPRDIAAALLCVLISLATASGRDEVGSQQSEDLIGQLLMTIQKLEDRVRVLEADAIQGRKEIHALSDKCDSQIHEHVGLTKRQGSTRNAFYAYMNNNLQYPHPDTTFVFDNIRTNVGSGYSNTSGVFTAPHAGTYVFTWTITVDSNSYVFSELTVNSVALGNVITDSQQNSEYHMTTGVVVAQLNSGDLVRVRSRPGINIHGSILSANSHRSSFSGWELY
ncbi:complement C1q-like protein 4 [Saccostrea echinata]|uniref:complement C1q-like protein 4 n=1 Tax=Saccostrea echinata TaxID=191078 RepID=UPI002A7FB736|nr:complement C1q-like protein 4 [Saccostrea echinata]